MSLSSKHREAQQRLKRMREDHVKDYNKHKNYLESRKEEHKGLNLTQIHQFGKTLADEDKDKQDRTEFLKKKTDLLQNKIRNPAEEFDVEANNLYHEAPISDKGGATAGSYLHHFGINSDDPDKYKGKKVNMKVSKDIDSWETQKRHGLAKRRLKTHGYRDVKGTNARFQYSYESKEDKDVTDELHDKTASEYLDEKKFKNLYTNDRDHRSDVVHGIHDNEEKKKFIDQTMNKLTDTDSKREFLRQQKEEIEKKTKDDDENNAEKKFMIYQEDIGKSDKEIEKKHKMNFLNGKDKIDTDKKVRDDLDKKTKAYFTHEADLNHKALQESNQSVQDHIEKHRDLLTRNEAAEDPQRKIEKKRLVNSLYNDHDKKFDEHFAERIKANSEHKDVGYGRNRPVHGGRKNFDATYEGEDNDGNPVTEKYKTHHNTYKDILEEHPDEDDDEKKMDDHLISRKMDLDNITAHTASYDKNMDEMKKELSKADDAIERRVISDRYKTTLEEHKRNIHYHVDEYNKKSFINKNRNNDHFSMRPLKGEYGFTNENDVDHQSEKAKKIAHLTDEEHSKFFEDGKYTDHHKKTHYSATQHIKHMDLLSLDEDEIGDEAYKLDERTNYVKNYHATVLNTHRELGHTEEDFRAEHGENPYEKIKKDAKSSYKYKYKKDYDNDKGILDKSREENEKQMEQNEKIFQKDHKIHHTKFIPEAEKSVGEYELKDQKKRADNYRGEAEKTIDRQLRDSPARDSVLDVASNDDDEDDDSMSSMSSRRSSLTSRESSLTSRESSLTSIESTSSTDQGDYGDEDVGEEDDDTFDQRISDRYSERRSNQQREHHRGNTTGYGNNGNFSSTTSQPDNRTRQTYESASQESTITTEGKHVPMGDNAAPTLHDENGKITHKFKDGSSLEFKGTVENGKPTIGNLTAKDSDGKPTKGGAYERRLPEEEKIRNNSELEKGKIKDQDLRNKHDSNPSNYSIIRGTKKEYKPSNDQIIEGTSKSSLKKLDPDTENNLPVSFADFKKNMSSGNMTDAEKSFESTFPSENQTTTAEDTVKKSINAANNLEKDGSEFEEGLSGLEEI